MAKMAKNEFYALALRKKVTVQPSNITEKIIKGRRFAMGTYTEKGKDYKVAKVLGIVPCAKKK